VLSPLADPVLAEQFPLVLGTGTRLPMYVHSRTFRNAWNRRLHPAPTVMISTQDAASRGIGEGDEVLLTTPRHALRVRARVSDAIAPGMAGIFHGWPQTEVNRLLEPDYLDPISGFPGFKSLLCQVQKA
jgi:anaerobic selenocysteine-containing dehydrogenase